MTAPHLQTMTAQEYIESSLEQLAMPVEVVDNINASNINEILFRLLTTKKFRKYSLNDDYVAHIKKSIAASIEANEPIKVVFFGGCYKLWRLEESPEADWAEVFAYMYYTQWLKPICAVYKPGLWFDFLLDDYIVPRLNNISEEDVESYRASRDAVLSFVRPFQPANLTLTHTGEGSLFTSREQYETSLDRSVSELAKTFPNGLPQLSEAERASVELNTRVTPEQQRDPLWREKVELLHRAYYLARNETGYYAPETNKIIAFTQPFAPGRPLAIGSTKDTVAKYWAGAGALKKTVNAYRPLVLSPKQLSGTESTWENTTFPQLSGKNFSRVRVVA